MYALVTLAMILANEAGSQQGESGGQEGPPGAAEGFGTSVELPDLAYPAIAAGIFLALLLVTFAFRSSSKRH